MNSNCFSVLLATNLWVIHAWLKLSHCMIFWTKKIQQFGISHEDLSIGELIILCYSRHSYKQFIHANPSHFGCKSWVLASAIEVPYKIEIYQGRTNQGSDEPLGNMLSKMLWKFVKIQEITVFTSTTSFQAIHWYVT